MSFEEPPPGTSLALDTDVFTHWRNQHQYVLDAITDYQLELQVLPALTAITVFEALRGIEDAIVKKPGSTDAWRVAKDRIQELLRNCDVLPLNETGAAIAAHVLPRLYPRLDRERRKNAWADVFIAATVIAHNYGLVSQNTQDFQMIGDLLPEGTRLYLTVWKP